MTQSQSGTDAIQQLCENALERFNAADYDGVAKYYTDETQFLAPGFSRITSREGVRQFWKKTFSAGYRFEEVKTLEIRTGGTMAYWLFEWIMSNPDGKGGTETQTGKNVIVWEETNDGWLIRLDSLNTPS